MSCYCAQVKGFRPDLEQADVRRQDTKYTMVQLLRKRGIPSDHVPVLVVQHSEKETYTLGPAHYSYRSQTPHVTAIGIRLRRKRCRLQHLTKLLVVFIISAPSMLQVWNAGVLNGPSGR